MRLVRWLTSLCVALISVSALAASYAVELPPQVDRAVADQLLSGSAVENGRVLRRYVSGQGWRYVVVVDGLASLDLARQSGARLAATGQAATIYVVDGDSIQIAEVVQQPALVAPALGARLAPTRAEPAVVAPAERPRRGATPEALAADVLNAAVRAHGGHGGGLERLSDATSVQFRFVRTVPVGGSSLVAEHRYVSQASGLRLEVDVSAGDGQDSVTVIDPAGTAWVFAGGQTTTRDVRRAREVLERFSPALVLAVPLGLPEDVETAEAWRSLRLDPTRQQPGSLVLTPGSQGKSGLASATFDAEDHTLKRVTWTSDGGELTFIYEDYQRLDRGLVVPFRARVERDGSLVEEVQVLELVLDQPVDPSLFTQPGQSG